MRTKAKTALCNVVLLVVLVVLSAATVEYQLLHQAVLYGKFPSAAETHSRFNKFTDDLNAFVVRQQRILGGDGRHSCVTLSYYPLTEPVGGGAHANTSTAAAQPRAPLNVSAPPLPPTTVPTPLGVAPLEAIRLRSSIVSKDSAVIEASPDGIPWRVQTERLGSSLLASPRTIAPTTSAPDVATRETESTATPTSTPISVRPSPASAAVLPTSTSYAARTASGLQEEREATATEAQPRRANAVILLMSPTFSIETVPTSVHVETANTTTFAAKTEPSETEPAVPVTNTAAASIPWRCRRCQQFLEKLLPSLEEAYLRRHAYPVHILHRGIMPGEVVQYITAILASASRITIEDVSGVLTEHVTLASTTVLEPWLKEMNAELHYRRRFITSSPISAAPTETTLATGRPAGGVVGAAIADAAGKGGGHIGAGVDGGGDGAAVNGAAGGGVAGGTAGGRNTLSPYEEADGIRLALRERWELRRFWTGTLFLLPSLQLYDFFWYVDSQSSFTKPLARDVLAEVANYSCAVAYYRVSYLTHKRVTDLWATLLVWNEQSGGAYFSSAELQRALLWLSDGQTYYGGKIYAPDCFVMSFAVTRHPAYLDFFHWIDSRAPYGLMRQQWSPLTIYTVFAELLMEKHGWDSCLLDPFSGYRTASSP